MKHASQTKRVIKVQQVQKVRALGGLFTSFFHGDDFNWNYRMLLYNDFSHRF